MSERDEYRRLFPNAAPIGTSPDRRCRFCEYFDAIGQKGADFMGDCHNPNSPRFTTQANGSCPKWWPSTTET